MYEVQVTPREIPVGRGFKPVLEWFVDCDGYSLGVHPAESAAKDHAARVKKMLLHKSPRDIHFGY